MKTSPFFMGFIYFAMGTLFTYLAIESAGEDIFTFPTILLMVIATFDYAVSLRLFTLKMRYKKITTKNKKQK
jgi:hypothetical protein